MITFDNVSVQLGGNDVLKNVSFNIRQNELAVLTGNSGSGKTTILRLVAGTLQPGSGTVRINGERTGFIFQDHRLLPWKTALDNIVLVLRAQGLTSVQARQKAGEWLDLVGLEQFAAYYPAQLSGGMVQRVSIARAFAIEPDIILMDEPFSSLDADLTDSLLQTTRNVLAEHRATVIYVTHDIIEALRMADRLFHLGDDGFTETAITDRQAMYRDYYESRLDSMRPSDRLPHS